MVTYLPKTFPPDGVFRGCVLRKNHHTLFDSGKAWRVQAPMKLVHNDLICFMNMPSLVGVKYILTFIDDFSRFTRVCFLRNKSNALKSSNNFEL